MNNFLRLSQQLPAHIKITEMKEICEIAKMFQSENIYQACITKIHQNINPNYTVSENKYDESSGRRFMYIEQNNPNIRYKNFNCTEKDNKIKEKSINYRIKIGYHLMKCPEFKFSNNEGILYTAKQQLNTIYIGEGKEVHINKDASNRVGQISQEHNRTNFILAEGKRFQVKYVESGKSNHFSLSVTFPYENKNVTWNPINSKRFLNFQGEYTTNQKKSKRNFVLVNSKGQTVLIFKKISDEEFEIETLQTIDPLFIFAIGLSGIIGPHDKPFGGF